MVLTVRHTRGEEEAGRLELLGATVVGRRAALGAAIAVVIGATAGLGLLTALGLMSAGLSPAGSLAFGASWFLTGAVYAAVAALVAQLAAGARAATGIASGILGATYLLRAVGDSSSSPAVSWLSWLSPIGWGQQVRAFAGDRWVVLALPLLAAVALVAAAFALNSRRDLDAGLFPDRPGRGAAGRGLASALGLAWRLQRGLLLGWLVTFALLGLVLGSIATSIDSMMSSQQAREFLTRLGGQQGLTDAFFAAELSISGVIVSVYGIQAAMRLRAEEAGDRAEALLATAVGRVRWAAGHVLIAAAGTSVLMLVLGTLAGVARSVHSGNAGDLGPVLAGALIQLPAAWLLTAVVVAAFGLAPRLVAVGWAALVAFLLLGELGPVMQLDQWALDLSPYAHVPKLPGGAFSVTPLAWLLLVTVALGGAGLVGLRRRDLVS